MVQDTKRFNDRLDRIQNVRQRNRDGTGFVVHADGVVTPLGQPSSRLRFHFPLKGVLVGLFIAVSVKAYLMWFLGTDVYTLGVHSLLSGTEFEQTAALILMPDALSAWVVACYDAIYAFIQAGLAAGEPA